jgi:hypothetical protein
MELAFNSLLLSKIFVVTSSFLENLFILDVRVIEQRVALNPKFFSSVATDSNFCP